MKLLLWTALATFVAATGGRTQSTVPSNQPMMCEGMMGQGMMGHGMMGHGMMGQHGMMIGSMLRHHQAMMNGIPEPYRSAANPLTNSPATLQRGAEVYDQNCASCHGEKGYGDGPAGQQLSPRPANLARLAHSHMVSDQYADWTVSEGGQPVGSAMPAFKGILSQRDIWAVVTYVRNGIGSSPHR
jgi:mono/diheme cytochrome c family protein